MDYGYPQFTEAKILAEYIKTDAYRMEVCVFGGWGLERVGRGVGKCAGAPVTTEGEGWQGALGRASQRSAAGLTRPPAPGAARPSQVTTVKPPMAVTNAVSWRSEGIRHKKNEVRWQGGACGRQR
jgi:hypothetical protein